MSACLLAIGLVNVKKKSLVVLATRLTLREEVTQSGSPQKECGGVCPNQPHASVGPGWSRRDRGPQPSCVPIGHQLAREVSPSGRSESMETSIGHRHE